MLFLTLNNSLVSVTIQFFAFSSGFQKKWMFCKFSLSFHYVWFIYSHWKYFAVFNGFIVLFSVISKRSVVTVHWERLKYSKIADSIEAYKKVEEYRKVSFWSPDSYLKIVFRCHIFVLTNWWCIFAYSVKLLNQYWLFCACDLIIKVQMIHNLVKQLKRSSNKNASVKWDKF